MSSPIFNINKVKHRLAKMGYSTPRLTWSDCGLIVGEIMGVKCPKDPVMIIALCQQFCGEYSPERCKEIRKVKTRRMRRYQKSAFYKSQAWREARYDVLKRSGGVCKLCGRSPSKHGVVLHVDHIQPLSKRPDLMLDVNNLQVLCEDCNLGKGNRDNTAF